MYKYFIKRLLDVILAIALIPLLLVVTVLVAPFIFLEDKGSVFYISDRLGKKGRVFKMYKFRTMKENSRDIRNADGSTYNGEYDSRVTKVGRFLRRTSIDELPQVLNVLRGEMSFIGPRPDLPEHILLYTKEEKRKLKVRPGITGYNQAYFRNSIRWKDKIRNDLYYIDNISLWMDLRIFLRTFVSVFRKDLIYSK